MSPKSHCFVAIARMLACGAILFAAPIGWAESAETKPRSWSSDLLRKAWAWEPVAPSISVTARGVRVEVPKGSHFHIAAANRILPPKSAGRMRIRVAEVQGDARWFAKLYGDLRRPNQRYTLLVGADQTRPGERVFDIDPRVWRPGQVPIQLQLGLEGTPGAAVIFESVEFLPPLPRSNPPGPGEQPGQINLPGVERMPNHPEPYQLIDWRAKAAAYDRFVFDFKAKGEFLPIIWLDETRINTAQPTFGLPSYVGAPDQAAGKPNSQESITCMGAVLGATLVGIDKSRQEHDYVAMCEAWFNSANGLNLVLNRQQAETGESFWYEIFPHMVFYAIADRYPGHGRLESILRTTAERWREACTALAGPDGLPDFDHTAFDFRVMKPRDNGRWREPDAAAGVAWLQYMAWTRSRDPRFLETARRCLTWLERREDNPYYEILLPFGVITAARLNAEHGCGFKVEKTLNWCFGVSDVREGWAVTAGRWGERDCDGLLGAIDNRGGYAFAMNTFVQAGALTPLARYDGRYARAIGKWMLNLANSARSFYPDAWPADQQSSAFWKGDPGHVIAYEGLRRGFGLKQPIAMGDPIENKWGPRTDLGLYGSGYVGLLGAIVRPTNVPKILQLDCLATDFFRDRAYATFLYFNPYREAKNVDIDVGPQKVDLYDAAGHQFLIRGVTGRTSVAIPGDSAVLLVLVPAGVTVIKEQTLLKAGNVVIDYAAR